MLDTYQERQPIIYQIIKNTVTNKKISHAYLLDSKNSTYGIDLALAFAKYLLCPYHKSNSIDCNNCTQCQKIDDSNYTELKIISPDGLWIKKEQLDELQEEFSKKAVEGNYQIYIIDQAEKLNKSAANSLLKFLEEPEQGIIALLVTNNYFQVLETIRSRCQILSFQKEKRMDLELEFSQRLPLYIKTNLFDCNNSESFLMYQTFINNVIHFLEYIELKGKEALLYTNKLWHHEIKEKEQILLALNLMIFLYKEVVNIQCGRPIVLFQKNEELLKKIAMKNTINEIARKMKVLEEMKKNVKVNINNNLLVDKLIIELVGEKTR